MYKAKVSKYTVEIEVMKSQKLNDNFTETTAESNQFMK